MTPLGARGPAGDSAIVGGGILAAGEGSRLRRDGWGLPKPLVPIAGVPLVEHAIGNFLAAGIERVAVIFNETDQDCASFVRSRFAGAGVEVVMRTTASSLQSFRETSARLPPGRALFATVDAWRPREDFLRFVRSAAAFSADATVLAVTPFVDDESPLRVSRDGASVREIGGVGGDAVTAGAYLFSARARKLAPPAELDRLRRFLSWLVATGEPVKAISIEEVVDVDRARDVDLAEDLARRAALRSRGAAP